MKQIHYIQGKEVNPPRNYEDVYIQGNKENDGLEIATTVKTFDWINAEAAILKDILNQGITGGQGNLSGVAHKIKLVEDGTVIEIFDGYIDLQTAQYDQDLVTADSVPKLSIEWLESNADSITFERLYEKTPFLNVTDVVAVPYVLSSVPNYQDLMFVSLTSAFIVTQIERQAIIIEGVISEIGGLLTAGSGIFKLISEAIYTITLLVSVVKLINDLIDLIIQQVKYKFGMSVNRQIEAACNFLGVNYQSPILESSLAKLHILPANYANPESVNENDNILKGFFNPAVTDQQPYYKGTLGDLLREIRTLFNLKVVFRNGTLVIEPKNQRKNATFTLPEHYNPRFKTNADEFISNYTISFAFDTTERTTIDQWEGNNVQVTLDYKTAPQREFRLLKGIERVSTTFARGFAKKTLTAPEKLVNSFLKVFRVVTAPVVLLINTAIVVINSVIDGIEKIVKLLNNLGANIEYDPGRPEKVKFKDVSDIENRIGMLQLENDFFSVDKLVLLDVNANPKKTKIATENDIILDAQTIFQTFHTDNSFDPSNKFNAQRFIYEYENVEMNLTEFNQVVKDGAVKLPTGEVCEVESYEYNAQDRLAKFVIRQRKIFNNNIQQTIYKPTGQ